MFIQLCSLLIAQNIFGRVELDNNFDGLLEVLKV